MTKTSRHERGSRNVDSRTEFDTVTRISPCLSEREGLATPRSELNRRRAPAGHKLKLCCGSWNVRTLVESDGDIATSSQNSNLNFVCDCEEKKINLVLRQLSRLGIDVAALQETLWFGSSVYHVDESIVVCSGHPVPDANDSCRRGEGVAIVLRGACRDAFTSGGSQWTSYSSRLLSLKLKFVCGRSNSEQWIHVASAYAPTFARPAAEKTQFYASVQQFLSGVPSSDHYYYAGRFQCQSGLQF